MITNNDLISELERAGFEFTKSPYGQWYWTWCGPKNNWDVECGEYQSTLSVAIIDAVRALVTYATEEASSQWLLTQNS